MASPPAWTLEDVRAFLRTYGRTPQALKVEPLPCWWFNLVLRVEADGEHLVIRRYGVTPPDEVRWELAVLAHLRRYGFPVIAPLPRFDSAEDSLGELLGKPAILYPFVEGRTGQGLDWFLALSQTAEVVARLHTLTEGLSFPHPRLYSGTYPPLMVRDLVEFTGRRGVAEHETDLRDFLGRATRTVGEFEARIAPYAEGLPRGVVHHDAHHANVLFKDDRLVALIDFDDAFEGYLVADVARMIATWATDWESSQVVDLDRALTVVREYERHRPLSNAERLLLPDFLRIGLMGDSAAGVLGDLEQGVDSHRAVTTCDTYQCFLHHEADADWLAAFRHALDRGA